MENDYLPSGLTNYGAAYLRGELELEPMPIDKNKYRKDLKKDDPKDDYFAEDF